MAELIDEFCSLSQSSSKAVEVCAEMLDYAFVEGCNDPNELRCILSTLICGQHGRYPHLEETVRNKLVSLLPEKEKSKIAAMRINLSAEDVKNAKNDLGDWLRLKKVPENDGPVGESKSLIKSSHPVRNTTLLPTAPTTHDEIDNAKTKKSLTRKEKLSTKEYFESWAKFSDESEDFENEATCENEKPKTTDDDTMVGRPQSNLELSELRKILANNEFAQAERQYMSIREREKGNEYFRSGEDEKAWHCYSKSVLLDPNAKSFANRATVLARLGRREEAIQDCTEAISIDPTYTKAIARRGMIFHQMQRYEEAIHDFELCASLDADGGYTRLREKSQAKLREQLQKKSPGQKTNELKIQEVGSSDQSDDVIEELYTPGILQIAQDGRTPETLSKNYSCTRKPTAGNASEDNVCERDSSNSWQRISIIDTSDSDEEITGDDPEGHLMRRVEIVVEENDSEVEFDDAEATGTERPSAQEKSESYKEEGNAAMSANRFEQAISHYTKALELDPKKASALNNRSLAYIKTSQYDKAITDATNCLALEPSNIKALYRRGLATMKGSKSISSAESARSDFKTALSFNPPKDQKVDLTKKLKECEMLLKSLVHTGSCDPQVQDASNTLKSLPNTKRKSHDTTALLF